MAIARSINGWGFMVMVIFSVNYIFRGDAKDGPNPGLYIDLPVFLKAIDETVNKSVNAKKMQPKQEKKGKGYSFEALLVCRANLLHFHDDLNRGPNLGIMLK